MKRESPLSCCIWVKKRRRKEEEEATERIVKRRRRRRRRGGERAIEVDREAYLAERKRKSLKICSSQTRGGHLNSRLEEDEERKLLLTTEEKPKEWREREGEEGREECLPLFTDLWSEVYRPRESGQVIGNKVKVQQLRNWLQKWKTRSSEMQRMANRFDQSVGNRFDQSVGKIKMLSETRQCNGVKRSTKDSSPTPDWAREDEEEEEFSSLSLLRRRRRGAIINSSDSEQEGVREEEGSVGSKKKKEEEEREEEEEFSSLSLLRRRRRKRRRGAIINSSDSEQEGVREGEGSVGSKKKKEEEEREEEEGREEGEGVCSTLLLCGKEGVGKTAAVYACAEELGLQVSSTCMGTIRPNQSKAMHQT